MKLAICGSRDKYIPHDDLIYLITMFTDISTLAEIVSGGASGIDAIAKEASCYLGVTYTEFPADWNTHGKAAGPIRNRQIAQYSDRLMVIRFTDSRGSISVASEFRKLGKPVYEIILPRE
jgi:predicted Rossmann fold nucleotide-binding protein DprA/Smf involved in DNA uptake